MAKKDGGMLFDGQFEDEDVQLVFHRHPIVMRKGLIAFLVVLIIGAIPSLIQPLLMRSYYIFGGSFFLGLLVFSYWWMKWYFSYYIVTDQRIVHVDQQGFFRKQVVELGHDKVQNVNYEIPGISGAIFQYGTIIVQTFVGDLVIDMIHHPERIHRDVSKIIRASENSSAGLKPTDDEDEDED